MHYKVIIMHGVCAMLFNFHNTFFQKFVIRIEFFLERHIFSFASAEWSAVKIFYSLLNRLYTCHLHFGFNFCEKWNPSNFGYEMLGRLKICWTLFDSKQISDRVFRLDSYVITYISGYLENIVIENKCVFAF